ncbi:hypothetical protein OS493_031457 [Desmophyllum pertusum]|uniref:Right handed beta helix domain-containing protein n=1 Tax=Desmophyllum pertusum TaxID=174260 RepID=A0A9W9ZXV8_9CNID|nr:hypothetical protein OS493_031457 [Desmophyllum pertusum]
MGSTRTKIEQDIWQLFVDGEMMTNARWPNALWSDKTVFSNKYWAKSAASSTRGKMVDSGAKNLAGSGLDVAGAMAILNIGSFNTFTAIVKSHTPGQNLFTYDDTFGAIKFKPSFNQYFLEDKLEFLDNAGEWFYDKSTKTVYVKTMDGKSPEGRIRGKVQTYAFTISNCQHLHFKQLTFFGTTIKARPAHRRDVINGLSFHSINFNFPSYSKRMLGDTAPPRWTIIDPSRGHSFQLINSTFYGTDGLALQYSGDGALLQNNLFEYNDWSVAIMRSKSGGFGTVISNGINDQFIRNTLRFNGASAGFRPSGRNPVVKLNHIHHQCWGVLQHDGAGVQFQIGAQTNALSQNNWVHSSPKYGLRFDGQPPRVGRNGTMKENVVWKCGGIMVKGEFHSVLNNLAFDKRNDKSGDQQGSGCSLCVLKFVRSNPVEINKQSVVLRNAADVANGGKRKRPRGTHPLAGKLVQFNIAGNVQQEVVDANNLDFRPRKDSSYNKDKVGPYRYNPSSKYYWIPGRQLYKASTPVPPHHSTTVKSDRDAVMWLNAFGASIHHVYFGTNKATVADATPTAPEHQAKITSEGNVHYLTESLNPGSTYYWRVDAEIDDTTTYKGDVWSFQTE